MGQWESQRDGNGLEEKVWRRGEKNWGGGGTWVHTQRVAIAFFFILMSHGETQSSSTLF